MRQTAPGNRYLRPLVPMLIALIGIVALVFVGNFVATANGAAPITGVGWLPFLVVGTAIIYGVYIAYADRPIWHVGTREVTTMALGSAIYGLAAWGTNALQLPAVSHVVLRPAVVIPALVGVLFGPVAGFCTGFVGNIFGDALAGLPVAPLWDFGNGLMGLIAGLATAFSRSRHSFNGIMIIVGTVLATLAAWLLLSPAGALGGRAAVVAGLWWLPLAAAVTVVGLRYALRGWPTLAVGLVWSSLGVVVGVGFAALADIIWSGYTPAEALLGEFVPAAGANLLLIAVLLPPLQGAYERVRRRES